MQAVLKSLQTWLFQLRGPESGEIVLVQRRIFILPTRGVLQPGRLTLYTRFPLGLYNAWSYIDLDAQCIVYPRPTPAGPPLPPLKPSGHDGAGAGHGQDDFAGLRQYHTGDSPRHIAW